MTLLAVPFDPRPPEKLSHIVDKCVAHRPWFNDQLWEDDALRREAVISHLVDAHQHGKLFEVWREGVDPDRFRLVGIVLFNELVPFQDVRCHFLFFDARLRDKTQLCLNMMAWAYRQLPVETLRVEVPTYAPALLKFVRQELGFRYEAENRPMARDRLGTRLATDVAALASRRYQATLYKGRWEDVLLLSQTEPEFQAFVRETSHGRSISQATEPGITTLTHSTGT